MPSRSRMWRWAPRPSGQERQTRAETTQPTAHQGHSSWSHPTHVPVTEEPAMGLEVVLEVDRKGPGVAKAWLT